ncbi:MAG: extracellular solute-binding protein [Anaerolineales bacterium]|nr:extracellular solute-binding protein [Anaerolineales bacterium]
MVKKFATLISALVMLSMLLGACAPAPTAEVKEIVKTVVVTEIVEVAGTPEVKEVVKEVVITATPAPVKQKLEIFHWWTAPGEREAADAMFAALKNNYPDIEVVENPVPGGGGVSHRVVLQARITAGLPPDTFQTLGGAELKNYVDSGILQPLDALYAELGYDKVIPGPLLKAVSVGGKPYVVPLNMHIQNILYYNLKLFNELGIQPPTTFDELLAACETIRAAKPEMACLGLGSKEKWGDAFVFDSILLELGGADWYVKLYKGEIDVATDTIFSDALAKFQQLIPNINTDHSGLTWDQAVSLVGSNQAAMTLMGTWAIGAFVKGSNWQPGVDFGAVTFPQKPERVLLFHPDTYGMTVGAPDPEATMNWLKVVSSAELQIPTDVTQGGLFARTDIDPMEFPDPIRQELQSYVAANPGMLILDQHGSILPATAQPIYWDIISAFLVQPDIAATVQAVANMMTTYNVKEASAWYLWP